jgi:hypothetical protein
MEKFNIKEYESHKVAGEYKRLLEDGTQVNQADYSDGYVEYTIPAKGWFYDYKEFNKDGNLKSIGTFFKKGDYQTGIGIYYNDNGTIKEEINYDRPYKLKIDSVFEILRKNNITFSLGENKNSIKRRIENSKAIWFIDWQITPFEIGTLDIDDASAKIIKKGSYSIQKN